MTISHLDGVFLKPKYMILQVSVGYRDWINKENQVNESSVPL